MPPRDDGPSAIECFFDQFQKLRKTLTKEESCSYAENAILEDNAFKLDWMIENKKLNLSPDLYKILKNQEPIMSQFIKKQLEDAEGPLKRLILTHRFKEVTDYCRSNNISPDFNKIMDELI